MGVKKAALINAFGKYLKLILSVFFNAILARILSPDDYGIVVIITVFSTFFTTISDMGFGAAIVQFKNLTQKDIDSIFSLTVYVAGILSIGFILFSVPISWFYKNNIYISLGVILSIAVFFSALNMVPNGILTRDKQFFKIAFRTVSVYTLSAVIAIWLAKCGFKYYSLVIQSALIAIMTFIWNYKSTRPKFRFKISKDSIVKVFDFSSYQLVFNITNYFSRNLDHLLTGKILGNSALGYYDKAYTLMLYPVNNLSGVLSPVLHPLLSEYQEYRKIIYEKYCKIARVMACIGIYVAVICYFSAYEIVNLMYGEQWKETANCFRYLSIAITPQMINSTMGAVYQSIGNTKLLFFNSCINTAITVLAIFVGIYGGNGIIGLSVFIAIAYVIHFITASFMLISIGFKYNYMSFIKQFIPAVVITICMAISILFYPFKTSESLYSFIIKCAYIGIVYLIAIYVTKEYKVFKFLIK